MARKKSPYEYVPKSLDETDDQWNQDPVKLNMTDGTSDPVNHDPERHLDDEQPDPFRWNKK